MSEDRRAIASVPDDSALPNGWDVCLDVAYRLLSYGKKPKSEEQIATEVKKLAAQLGLDSQSPYYEQVCRNLRDVFGISPDPGHVVSGTSLAIHRYQWLKEARESGEFREKLWEGYKLYLLTEKHRDGSTLHRLDQVTDDILNLMPDPRDHKEPVTTKGLLIGDVQSGKTQTYMALINKAADYGYKFFVILTSDNERLRRQTQERTDTDFIGMDSLRHPIGVRTVTMGEQPERNSISALTSATRDFNKQAKDFLSGVQHPKRNTGVFIAVLKKNKDVLRAFQKWVKEGSTVTSDVPMLIIDDESDYASVNTSAEGHDRTVVNKLIGDILTDSKCRAYLAVTATPFANIFIDDEASEDLFPEDFIYELDSPSSYLGAKQLFGDLDHESELNDQYGDRLIRLINQEEIDPWLGVSQKKDEPLGEGLDPQVQHAINTYVVACALNQLSRHPAKKLSMLIHASRFVSLQQQIADHVHAYIEDLDSALKYHGDGDPRIEELKKTYEQEYAGLRGTTWQDVRPVLNRYVDAIRVRLENHQAEKWNEEHDIRDDVDYDYSIFVGGNSLSRGMTLPGLVVSFFYRNVGAADTLLQMGRWFGYRNGYEDLMRVWLLPETVNDFRYSAQVLEDLKATIDRMHEQGATPKQFGIMIQKNPETKGARITSSVKSRNAVEHDGIGREFNIAGIPVEAVRLSYNPDIIKRNDDALVELVSAVQKTGKEVEGKTSDGKKYPGVVYHEVPAGAVSDFLSIYRAGYRDRFFGNIIATYHDKREIIDNTLAHQYAQTQQEDTKLFPEWDVIFEVTGAGMDFASATDGLDTKLPFPWVSTTLRGCISDGEKQRQTMAISGRNLRLAGPWDVRNYVDAFGKQDDMAAFEQDKGRRGSERNYYQFLNRPCLFLYMVNPEPKDGDPLSAELQKRGIHHSLAAKLAIPVDKKSFDPENSRGTGAVYYWNTVQQREYARQLAAEYGSIDLDDDDFEED